MISLNLTTDRRFAICAAVLECHEISNVSALKIKIDGKTVDVSFYKDGVEFKIELNLESSPKYRIRCVTTGNVIKTVELEFKYRHCLLQVFEINSFEYILVLCILDQL